jgi:hypothetical protein
MRAPLLLVIVVALGIAGCSKKVPPDVQGVIDAQHAAALEVAAKSALACPPWKARAPFQPSPVDVPAPAGASPAKGTSLEAEAKVNDVFVMCSWADPRDSTGATWAGTGLPSLKGTRNMMTRPVTMPEDVAVDTCKKSEGSCEKVIVPSRYSASARSADLRIVRPTADGGRAEITVVFVIP